jgi:N-acetylglucosaminyldiphosphoundecaprenol N-acetyl-beta-D-mannosaminyltransferase
MRTGHAERKVSLLGCVIDALTFSETLDEIDRLIADGRPVQHCVVNAAKIVLLERDPRLREIVSTCALVNADGQSVVWAARILGRPLPERVAGIDLFLALLGLAEARGYGVYFMGGTPDVVAVTAARARREHPALRIAGHHDGYLDAGDTEAVVAEIRAARPEILFVGMPSPRKEYWLAEHLESLGVPFSMGVGGSFDVYAGKTRRAPAWIQRVGFEWAYRLTQEPTRMWKRYLVGNATFLWLLLKECRREGVAWARRRDDRTSGSETR